MSKIARGVFLLFGLAAVPAAAQDAVNFGELRLERTFLFERENADVLVPPTVPTAGLVVECPRLHRHDHAPCVLEVMANVSVSATSPTPVVWGVILAVDGTQYGNGLGTAYQGAADTRSWSFFVSNVALGSHTLTLHTYGNGAPGEVGTRRIAVRVYK